MYHIRFHGRGGQGVKTASRILGSALFAEGFEVQDAPRYGAERRGAPLFAYVRADRRPIHERGVITRPDLVVVADESLVPVPSAGVLQGLGPGTVLLLLSSESPALWRERLNLAGKVLCVPSLDPATAQPLAGAACAGAASRLLGVVSRERLAAALDLELADREPGDRAASRARALESFDALTDHAGVVRESGPVPVAGAEAPDWIELGLERAERAAPDVYRSASSVQVRTGLWRTLRPVVDAERCNHCSWVCSTFCPDGAIGASPDGVPRIDLDHCKGCMICVAVCPTHAIRAESEREAAAGEGA